MSRPALCLCLALAACGDGSTPPGGSGPNDYTLRGTSPYPEQLAAGAAVRNLVLRVERRAGPMMRDDRCGYSFVLFDVTRASTQAPLATGAGGDCKLYMEPPERDYAPQRWVCAGGINTESAGLQQLSGFCPQEGASPPWEGEFRSCGAFLTDRTAAVSSMDEIGMDDRVTDLAGTVRFPPAPSISLPSALPVATWPASGDLTVAWAVAEATSVVVRLAPDGDARTGPTVICTPRVNGRVVIDGMLLDRAGFRTRDVRLRVWAYRETTTQAEGRAWNLVGAAGTSVLLQPGR